jgi:hypothetical protein
MAAARKVPKIGPGALSRKAAHCRIVQVRAAQFRDIAGYRIGAAIGGSGYILLALTGSSANCLRRREPLMLRRISVAASCVAMLALGVLPAAAATSRVHAFSIPGVYGVRAWGTYYQTGIRVRVTVCVEDTSRDVYGAAAAGVTFNAGYTRHSEVSVATVGYGHLRCATMATPYTDHLVVDAVSGYRDGKVRRHGEVKQIY